MRSLARFLGAAILAINAAAPASAPPETARWISRWDRGECSLIRAVGDAERFSIKVVPGSGLIGLWVRSAPDASVRSGSLNARLVLQPSGALETSSVNRYPQARGGDVFAVILPDQAALAALASARTLQLSINDTTLVDLPLGNIAGGVDVLRQCMSDQLRTWGLDPDAIASLRQRPVAVHPRGLIGFLDDYPVDALRRGVSGAPVIRLDVDAQGRLTNCAILESSGDRALDRGTCQAFMRRARFHPALDAAGVPTAASLVTKVYWWVQG